MRKRPERTPVLLGRERERAAIDGLLADLRAGRGRALMLRGEAGVGKSALLDYAATAADARVLRAVSVESEMELAFAGLHLLCMPLLDRMEALPAPQRDALAVAFGLREGGTPDLFMVGLAILTLLAEAAEEQPLLCLIDDAQWLDQESTQVLAFAARRLLAEPVALVFAARDPGEQFRGLAELEVRGLPERAARALLGSVVPFELDERVLDRILAETRGNPLALMELPRGLGPVQLAGEFALIGAQAVRAKVERGFLRRLEALPADTRSLMLVAAAEPTGDPLLLWRAATRLGIPTAAAGAAQDDDLLRMGTRVRFRHPLVRSAVLSAASRPELRAAHLALAEVTDRDPDRRAWHLAAAATGPDEAVAAELERSAGRAQARGGMAAAASFLQRAAELTGEPAVRSERALAAAEASLQAGALAAAGELLAMGGTVDELQQAREALVRGRLAFASGGGSDAPALLLKAARQLESLDPAQARGTYLDAWYAAVYAGPFAGADGLNEVSQAARSAPPSRERRAPDLLLDGLAALITEGRDQAVPLLRAGTRAFAGEEITVAERQRWSRVATVAAVMLWDEECWEAIQDREIRSCREAGLLTQVALALGPVALMAIWRGDFAAAASLAAEEETLSAATGVRFAPRAALFLAGFRGNEHDAALAIQTVAEASLASGLGVGVQMSQWISAVLYNGLGCHESALAQARKAAEQAPALYVAMWTLPELVEAASRTGQTRLAADALARLGEATSIGQTDWGQGIYARSKALLSDGKDAERWYREATVRLGRTGFRSELARAHLLYGEWLRRAGRRADARAQLGIAFGMFTDIGMLAFADRTRRELQAVGTTVRKRTIDNHVELTPQEAQIARLARDGMSNREIAAQLFLSPRTAEYHLAKVFTKLGISSRRQLPQALPDGERVRPTA